MRLDLRARQALLDLSGLPVSLVLLVQLGRPELPVRQVRLDLLESQAQLGQLALLV